MRYFTHVLAYVAGVCALQLQPTLPPWWPFLLGGIVLLAVRRASRNAVFLTAAIFCFGFAWAGWRAQVRLVDWLPAEQEMQVVEVEGYVADLPQATRFGNRFLFVPQQVITQGAHLPQRISVNWYGDPDRVRAGERWLLVLKPKRPHGQINPGGFDLESWFLQHGIGATATVQYGRKLPGLAAAAWLAQARSALRERIRAALPDALYAGVIVALTVGDQGGIPDEQWRRFAATGVTHLISISGLHVTMLAGLAAFVTGWLWRRAPFLVGRFGAPRAALLAGVLTALAYCLLAGMAVPTQRTLLMLAVVAFCLWRARPAAINAIWACALGVVVLIDPFAALSVGFWLSFLTVGALLWIGANRLGEPAKWRGWMMAQGAATLGSAPVLLAVFGQLPLISPLANALAIPLVSLIVTPLALFGLADPTGGLLLGAERVFALTDWLLAYCASLPLNLLQLTPPPQWTLLPAALGVALLLAPRGIPGKPLGIVFLLPLFVLRPDPLPGGGFRATVLDVGQGLSVLVETRNSALLFDVGQIPNGDRVAIPALRAAGRIWLDTLLLSHDDNDHTGGAEALLAGWPVGEIVHGLPDDSPLLAGRLQKPCQAGLRWQRDGVSFSILWPPDGYSGKGDNARSCVLLVDNGKQRLLLPGDLGGQEEVMLVENGLPQTGIVVAGHHGGKGSSLPTLVDALQPQYAVFSVGYRNRFRHPRADTLERFAAAGATGLRTDESGALVFDVGDNIAVRRWREVERRYWYTGSASSR